jgi:uncharacterized protein
MVLSVCSESCRFKVVDKPHMSKACHLALLIALTSVLPAAAADYAPLRCAKAATSTEKAICASYSLGQAEARMATLYQWATSFVAMGQRGVLQDQQSAFIKKREACRADATCIRNAYNVRIEQLEAVMDNVKQHGPF